MIEKETKKNILDHFEMEGILFSGRMGGIDFLERLYPLSDMESNDPRCENAYGDIWQHTVNNNDLEGNWVFQDSRFGLLNGEDEVFLKFITEMAHPLVRPDTSEANRIIAIANDWLKSDGWELYPTRQIAGGNIYGYKTNTGTLEPMPTEDELAGIWSPNSLRLFISHRDQHKEDVKKLSDDLKLHGISGFVAHESVPEQSFWRLEILKSLRSMDACLCYITEDFFESIWTNQEIGYAMAKGVPIYLFRVDKVDPKGFMSDIQAIKTGIPGLLTCIKKDFSNNSNFKKIYIQNFIEARDGGFSGAKDRFFDLVGLKFNDDEIETLIRAITEKKGKTEAVNKLHAVLLDNLEDRHKSHPLLRKYSKYREYLEKEIVANHTSKSFSFKKTGDWAFEAIEVRKTK